MTKKKSRIQETLNLSACADSSTDAKRLKIVEYGCAHIFVYKLFFCKQFCLESVLSGSSFVWKQICLESVLSESSFVWTKQFCLEAFLSGSSWAGCLPPALLRPILISQSANWKMHNITVTILDSSELYKLSKHCNSHRIHCTALHCTVQYSAPLHCTFWYNIDYKRTAIYIF